MPELPSETLTARVQARVDAARLNAGKRPVLRASGAGLESAPLRRVFQDLGVTYRRYRSQTRTAVVPGLRDAAYNFRAEPSLTSLVAVAAFLDELDLLS